MELLVRGEVVGHHVDPAVLGEPTHQGGVPVAETESYKLQVTSYKLQVTSYKLQATSYKLQVTSYTSYRYDRRRGESAVHISSRLGGQDVAEMWPRYRRDIAEISPRYRRDMAEIWLRCRRDIAGISPGYG